MSSQANLLQCIAQVQIFQSLKKDYQAAIAGVAKTKVYKKGEKIIRQGEQGEEFFVILSGSVRILLEDYGLWTEQRVLTLEQGQSFGESSLLSRARRSATVQAIEETTCAVIGRGDFEKLLVKLPEVAVAVCRYLAERLAVQCKLTGYRFVSAEELVYEPRLYKAFDPSVLRRYQAIPINFEQRTMTIALTRPNDTESLRALQNEIPGFGLEAVACSVEDYTSFIHRYRLFQSPDFDSKSIKDSRVLKDDGTSVPDPLRNTILGMVELAGDQVIIETTDTLAQLLVRQGEGLEPFLPSLSGQAANALSEQLDQLFENPPRHSGAHTLSVRIENRPYQISISVLRGRGRSRYALRTAGLENLVPPLESLFPSEGTVNLIQGALRERGRIIFLTGSRASGLSETMYSLLDSLGSAAVKRNVLVFENSPLLPQNEMVQLPLPESLNPQLAIATAQNPEVIALDSLDQRQLLELLFQDDSDTTILALYRHDDLLDVLSNAGTTERGRPASLNRVKLILEQRLARRICHRCSERYSPEEELLQSLEDAHLTNEGSSYFRGKGCDDCNQTGVRGHVPLFEAINCNREMLEGLSGSLKNRDRHLAALNESLVFSFRGFAKILISKGLIDPFEALRIFPPL